jgi:hypothetical protein
VEIINDPKLQGFNSIVGISIDGKLYEQQFNILNINLKYDEKKEFLLRKFRDLAENYASKETIQELIKKIGNLEQEDNMADIIHLCAF